MHADCSGVVTAPDQGISCNYRIYAIHSRTIFSIFSLFGETIFQIYEVKSATMFRGRLCFKGDYVLRKYGIYIFSLQFLSTLNSYQVEMNTKQAAPN